MRIYNELTKKARNAGRISEKVFRFRRAVGHSFFKDILREVQSGKLRYATTRKIPEQSRMVAEAESGGGSK